MTEGYSVSPARYAKARFIIRPTDSVGGYRGRASYLCGALNLKWVNRSNGYTASASKLRKFEQLYREGWSATLHGRADRAPGRAMTAHQPSRLDLAIMCLVALFIGFILATGGQL